MGFFRGPDGGLLTSPLIKGVVAMLFITAGAMGLVYGIVTGKFKNDSDVINGMGASEEHPCPCGEDGSYIARDSIQRMDLLEEAGCAAQV